MPTINPTLIPSSGGVETSRGSPSSLVPLSSAVGVTVLAGSAEVTDCSFSGTTLQTADPQTVLLQLEGKVRLVNTKGLVLFSSHALSIDSHHAELGHSP
jgi:hypothetical protein